MSIFALVFSGSVNKSMPSSIEPVCYFPPLAHVVFTTVTNVHQETQERKKTSGNSSALIDNV